MLFVNLVIIRSFITDEKLFYGEAISKIIMGPVKASLNKFGFSNEGLYGLSGLISGAVCADQVSKQQRVQNLENKAASINERLNHIRYTNPDYTLVSNEKKVEIQNLQNELMQTRDQINNTGGLLYEEITNMADKFVDKF